MNPKLNHPGGPGEAIGSQLWVYSPFSSGFFSSRRSVPHLRGLHVP